MNMNKDRLFAMSDIHGKLSHFKALVKKLDLKKEDTLVLMGDYIDRGEDSKGVMDFIVELKEVCNLITLLGNHEAMMRDAFMLTSQDRRYEMAHLWLRNGGIQTLKSYGLDTDILTLEEKIPEDLLDHLWLIRGMPMYHITDTHIFVHSTPRQGIPIEEHTEEELIWRRPSVKDKIGDYKHMSGKIVVSGHTAQSTGRPTMLSDYNILIDTGCFFTGVLTAIEICDTMHPTHDFIFHKVDGADL